MKSSNLMPAHERKAAISLASIYGLRMLGMFLLLPIFAIYAEKLEGGQDHTLIGWAMGAYGIMQVLMQLPFGIASDKFGRKKSLIVLLLCASLGFFVMSHINSSWPIELAVAAMVWSSFFLGSAAGCVFAVVPLIRRSLTGQIAGIVGAYGNIGAVVFLTVFSFVSTPAFFMTIAASILVAAGAAVLLDEPKDKMFEVMPDGSVQMIEVH